MLSMLTLSSKQKSIRMRKVLWTSIDDRRYLLLLLTPYAESYGLLMGNKIDAYHALGAAAAHHHTTPDSTSFRKFIMAVLQSSAADHHIFWKQTNDDEFVSH